MFATYHSLTFLLFSRVSLLSVLLLVLLASVSLLSFAGAARQNTIELKEKGEKGKVVWQSRKSLKQVRASVVQLPGYLRSLVRPMAPLLGSLGGLLG